MSLAYMKRGVESERKGAPLKLGNIESRTVPIFTPEDNSQPLVELHDVPVFLIDAFNLIRTNGLRVEGIFRREGNAKRVDMLTAPFYGQVGIPEVCSVHDICSLVKRFLREIQVPLLASLQDQFIQFVSTLQHPEIRVKTALELCYVLPRGHMGTLGFLMRQLKIVSDNSADNRMDRKALSTVLAPSIFHGAKSLVGTTTAMDPSVGKASAALHRMRDDIQAKAAVIELLIENAEKIGVMTPWEKALSPKMYEDLLPEDRKPKQSTLRQKQQNPRRISTSFNAQIGMNSARVMLQDVSKTTSSTTPKIRTNALPARLHLVTTGDRKNLPVSTLANNDSNPGQLQQQQGRRTSDRQRSRTLPIKATLPSARNQAPIEHEVGDSVKNVPKPIEQGVFVASDGPKKRRSGSTGVGTILSSLTNRLRFRSPNKKQIASPSSRPPITRASHTEEITTNQQAKMPELLHIEQDSNAAKEILLPINPSTLSTSPLRVRTPSKDVNATFDPRRSASQSNLEQRQMSSALEVRKGMVKGRRRFTTPVKGHPLRRNQPNTLNTGLREPPERRFLTDLMHDTVSYPSSSSYHHRRLSRSAENLRPPLSVTIGGIAQETADETTGQVSSSFVHLLDQKGREAREKRARAPALKSRRKQSAIPLPIAASIGEETEIRSPDIELESEHVKPQLEQAMSVDSSSSVEMQEDENTVSIPATEEEKPSLSIQEMMETSFDAILTEYNSSINPEVTQLPSETPRNAEGDSDAEVKETVKFRQSPVASEGVTEADFAHSEQRVSQILSQSHADQAPIRGDYGSNGGADEGFSLSHFTATLRPSVAFIREEKKGLVKNRVSVYQQEETKRKSQEPTMNFKTPALPASRAPKVGSRVSQATARLSATLMDRNASPKVRLRQPTSPAVKGLKRLGTNEKCSPKSPLGGRSIRVRSSFLKPNNKQQNLTKRPLSLRSSSIDGGKLRKGTPIAQRRFTANPKDTAV